MAPKKIPKLASVFEDRKQEYMRMFAQEDYAIRASLVNDLPAYHALLSMQVESFEELACRQIAKERGVSYDKDKPPLPVCPQCGKTDSVGRKEGYIYRCRSCNITFSVNHNSIASGTKIDALTWMKVLQCILDYSGLSKTCDYCGINNKTYYNIRNRLFYAMELLLKDVKLYGEIQVDTTYVRSSYKGLSLKESEVDEDSIFFDPTFRPRKARQRGGSFAAKQRNANNVCVFTAIDDRGHVIAKFAGIGLTNHRILSKYIPSDKYLLEVPRVDPFHKFAKSLKNEPKTKTHDVSLMIADKESAIKKYAEQTLGIQFKSHVYHKDHVQRRLPSDGHNIQKVNALHRRLKEFLRNTNYVATKYLPGYLVLFEFIENTGATTEAIERLFEIIATPGLGQSASFYDNMYTVPNYMVEWLSGDNPLKKYSNKKLLAFYLRDQIVNPADHPNSNITMKDIEEETGYSDTTIRRNYLELNNAGYRDLILDHFGRVSEEDTKIVGLDRPRAGPYPSTTINPVILTLYDEYAANRLLPSAQRLSLDAFLEKKNKELGTSFKRPNMYAKFKMIQDRGLRPPFETGPKSDYVQKKSLALVAEYDKIVLSYREKGEKVPPVFSIYAVLGKKYNLAEQTVQSYIVEGRAYLKKTQKE